MPMKTAMANTISAPMATVRASRSADAITVAIAARPMKSVSAVFHATERSADFARPAASSPTAGEACAPRSITISIAYMA